MNFLDEAGIGTLIDEPFDALISRLGQWLLQQRMCWMLLFHLTCSQQHCKKPLAGPSENSDILAFLKLHLFKTSQYLVQTLTFFPGWVKHLSSKIWQKENKTNKRVVLSKHKDFFYLSLKDNFLVSLVFILFKEHRYWLLQQLMIILVLIPSIDYSITKC